jgi:hypothetical protein
MISIINYISAKNRLRESDKTIKMLGTDCPNQFLAQNDMIRFECEHYFDESKKFLIKFFIFFVIIFLYLI